MTLPPMELPYGVLTLMDTLEQAGYTAYTVGGCVRDHLRGVSPHDYDVTTDATPEQMQAVFSAYRTVETGLSHGTLTVLIEGEPYEVTTFRIDGEYSDHRRPNSVAFTPNLKEDLARRDFTVNAIAYSPSAGYVDPFDGTKDLEKGILRAVGDPSCRFREDALRILRGIRFSSVLGYDIEEKTREALFACAPLLSHVSAERVRDEILKLLSGQNAPRVVRDYADILAVCIPEIQPMLDCPQVTPYHNLPLWEHSIKALSLLPPSDPILRLAGLLHDVGKPQCRLRDKFGQDHFPSHPEAGEKLIQKIGKDLKLDNRSLSRLTTLLRRHDHRTPPVRGKVLRLLNEIGYEHFSSLCLLTQADLLSHNTQNPRVKESLLRLEQTAKLGDELEAQGVCYRLSCLHISGSDILEHTPLRGTAVGNALNTLLFATMDEKVANERSALLEYLNSLLGIVDFAQ